MAAASFTQWKSMPPAADAAGFAAARARARSLGGATALRAELESAGIVARGLLTTGTSPFNVFVHIGSGLLTQPGMEAENAALGAASAQFCIACNRSENDEQWANESPEWVGKASMSKRHRFLILRDDLSWQSFNVLTLGLVGGSKSLRAAIALVEGMRDAARTFASCTPGWSAEPTRLGMFFHCYPHNSVNSLHMHRAAEQGANHSSLVSPPALPSSSCPRGSRLRCCIAVSVVDLSVTGPTFTSCAHKNLPCEAVLAVLRDELTAAEAGGDTAPGPSARSHSSAITPLSDAERARLFTKYGKLEKPTAAEMGEVARAGCKMQ